jgi:thiol-disulfide isomerase/thioredoxin
MSRRASFAAVVFLCFCSRAGAAEPAAPPSVLHLINDGFVPGQIQGSSDTQVLRWSSPFFVQPLEFPLSAVRAVQYVVPSARPKPAGTYCFELAGGDVLYGELLAMTDEEVEIDVARIGRVHVRREQIGRFYAAQAVDTVYLGPNGLTGWKESAATHQWRDEGGQLVTDHPGASIVGEVGIPAKAVIEFELSWKKRPDFLIALGVNDQDATVQRAFRFEVWDNDLVAVGESERDADVAPIEQLGPGEGHMRVQVYLDQEQRRMLLLSRNGKLLADFKINTRKGHDARSCVRLTNRAGDIRLEHLRITRWNGVPPTRVREDQSRLHRTDGSIVYGQLTGYDAKQKEFTIRDGATETRVKQEAIADVFLSPTLYSRTTPTAASESAVRVAYHDGTSVGGKITRLEDTHVSLTCPGIREPLRLPLAGLRYLQVFGKTDKPATATAKGDGRAGRLELDGVLLRGRLVAGAEQAKASCLVWQPDQGLNSSPLLAGTSGRVVYRDPPPPAPKVVAPQIQRPAPKLPARLDQKVLDELLGNSPAPAAPAPPQPQKLLHLRSGDTIPCEVTGIDAKGVSFKTPISDATFVAHEKVKSVELVVTKTPPRLNKAKRERLLTLPRMQKEVPPTHLICSTNGDFLRGRILEMDDKTLHVEVRLETRDIPRDRVAQIIWLHADELAPAQTATPPAAAAVTRVQSLRFPGSRLTFVAQKVENNIVSGVSEVVGPCRANLAEVDQLLFGAYIDRSVTTLAYNRWKLHNATEPKFVQAEAAAAADQLTGTESPLCGQPAYAFKLDLLDGQRFQLADHKGRVVVLDFWATWCGPCMQSMPLVEQVVRDFAGQGVELIAVNMEEQPDQIKAMLERHKLKLTVVLDRDGVAAAKYQVTAIPQTVVVDKEGKIARLYVGGGQKTADSLRKALQELVAGKPAAATPQ